MPTRRELPHCGCCGAADSPSERSNLSASLIGCDSTLEVVDFHAGDQANLFQGRKLLLGFGGIPEHQIEFTKVLMRAAVAAIEHQRLLVKLHRRPELAQPTIGIADVVMDVGIAWVAQ